MYVNNIRSKDMDFKSYNSDDILSKFCKLEAMCNLGILHNRLHFLFKYAYFLDVLKVKLIKQKNGAVMCVRCIINF